MQLLGSGRWSVFKSISAPAHCVAAENNPGGRTKVADEAKRREKAREWHPEDKGRKQASPWRTLSPNKRKGGEAGEDEVVHLTASISSGNCKGH